ncbi:hypothetical protein [Photobacterium kishitanii]|nr:hypothetical protein [Photobacterium kishitanii]
MKYDLMSVKKILFIGNQNKILSDINHLAFFYNFELFYKKTSSYNIADLNTNNYDCIIIDINTINNTLLTELQDKIATTTIKIIIIHHKNDAQRITLSKV